MKLSRIAILSIFALWGCSDSGEILEPEIDSACAYDSRKTQAMLTNEAGTVKITKNGTDVWTDIVLDSNLTPLCPCNLPISAAKDGLRVVITAEVKEIYPNEKWRCQPVKLKEIQVISSSGK
ncbi:hypothetical protein [Arundinibacter roseus]|uniref:Uncharacterized protein n=1 Tax=Arundinibacter roseus TaxID=2070510 RepID=A0A4R4K4S5_9BACT|nr:hypothetical protein [Arundinibacter roseus]TDB61109.1 hypothetical protein EZE20_19775 [Arundinibacter roseus]